MDGLGARSNDVKLEVSVGPGVDRPPYCHPSSYWAMELPVSPVHSRAGARRRFGVICTDLDNDPFASTLTSPPERGALAMLPFRTDSSPYWGFEQFHDATYVPADGSEAPDEFVVSAAGARADPVHSRMAIVPLDHSLNHGGSCGGSVTEVRSGVPAIVEVSCDDNEGDPITAEVSGALHGVAGPPVTVEGVFGTQTIKVPYVSEPGYEGYDCIKVLVDDGHGIRMELRVDLQVEPVVKLPELPELPPLPVALPELPGPANPATPPLPRAEVASIARSYAELALGTPAVARLPAPGDALVYAARTLPRRELQRDGRVPAVAVVCPTACRIAADARLYTGRRARGGRRRSTTAAAAGQAQLVWLDLDRAQLRALERARGARAVFGLRVAADGAPARSTRRSIPIKR